MDKARKELEPRLLTLVNDAIPLDEALKLLQETGNTVVDRRKNHRDNPKLKLDLKNATFWQALDGIIGKLDEIHRKLDQGRCRYHLHQDDGTLALVDGTPPRQNTAYAGICRLALGKVSLLRFEDSGSSFCDAEVELTWEPRFLPIYVDVEDAQAQFAAPELRNPSMARPRLANMKDKGKGRIKVAGQRAVLLELRFDAPPRSCPSMESLACQVKLIGPAKMLTFRLADLKPTEAGIDQTQEDVKVNFKTLPLMRDLWTFDVTIFNPPGAYNFESNEYEDWFVHNRIFLEKNDGSRIDHKPGAWAPVPDERFSFRRAPIRYDFEGKMPEKTVGWSLVYRTPGRIVDLPVSFTLKNILLP